MNEEMLRAVTDLVPFLRWRIGPPAEGELVSIDLARRPDDLAGAVRATAAGRGTDDHQVAASLWWQAYAYRVAGTTLACWLVSGAAPDPAAEGMAVGISRWRPSSVSYSASAPTVRELPALVERLFAGHLDRVAESLRARHSLGSALVAGNTAASIESALGAVVAAPGAAGLEERRSAIRSALPADVTATVDVTGDEPRRRTCCLWWKTSDAAGRLCADCSLPAHPAATTVPGDD